MAVIAVVGLCGVSKNANAARSSPSMASATADDSRQEHIHRMGSHVMPFQLAKTQHVFEMSDAGGNAGPRA